MKIISLFILSIIFTISSSARENPFEPTDQFLEQKEIILEANKQAKITQEQEEKEQLEALKQKLIVTTEPKKEKIEIVKIPETKTVATNDYIPEIKQNFKILPFVKIVVINDVLTIKVDTKYKLLNQDILRPAKKLLFDFEGNESFYTVRKDIVSEDFKSLTVGTHMKEKYFRVVIDLPMEVSAYIENIDGKNNLITIQKR